MGMFDFLTGEDPSKKAMKYLNKIPGKVTPYYDPYINAGQESLGTLKDQYGKLLSDPGGFYNELGEGYKKSPGFDFALKQALGGAGNAAAAGGMAGSPMHEQWAMETSSDLASKDFDRYMQDVLGLYGKGLGGEEGLFQTGYGASDTLAKLLADNLGSKANNAFAGAANNNQSMLGLLGALTGAATGGVSNFFNNKNKTPKYLDPFGLF